MLLFAGRRCCKSGAGVQYQCSGCGSGYGSVELGLLELDASMLSVNLRMFSGLYAKVYSKACQGQAARCCDAEHRTVIICPVSEMLAVRLLELLAQLCAVSKILALHCLQVLYHGQVLRRGEWKLAFWPVSFEVVVESYGLCFRPPLVAVSTCTTTHVPT